MDENVLFGCLFWLNQKQTPRLNGIVKTTKLFHNWSQNMKTKTRNFEGLYFLYEHFLIHSTIVCI